MKALAVPVLAWLALPLPAAPTTGGITRDLWTGVGGAAVVNLTSLASYPASPNSTSTLSSFRSPTNVADNYGQRVSGWIHAPVTGNYVFEIHADDNAELWLSTTRFPEERIRIASIPEWTGDGDWTKFPSQRSSSIPLVAGQYYFIEALQKEGSGGDNLGVAWTYTGQTRTYIPGTALSVKQNLPPEASPDTATVGVSGTVGIPVLANDRDPNGAADLNHTSLQIVTAPTSGTTSIDTASGIIRYTHNGNAASSDSLTYRIRDFAGVASTATVTLTISPGPRLPLASSRMPAAPPAQSLAVVDAFPALNFSAPIHINSPPGEPNRLFVVERAGQIRVISDLSNPTSALFLNLPTTPTTVGEQGLLSMAFHPQYATNGQFFVVYSVVIGGNDHQRLSRFTVSSGNANQANPASETVFLEMRNEASNHNGGDLHFGSDGYLYMSWGDEGDQNDGLNNSQRIDRDFWSSVTRIDVDLEPQDYTASDGTGSDDSNVRPNAHPAVVLDGGGNPRYEVPADNPWVGATSFLGSPVTPANVRTEFYAVGLRNPFRFSFDGPTGTLWLGDVGQGAREEVNKIVLGGNYEWAFREGFAQGAKWSQRPTGWTGSHPPVIDYGHGSGPLGGRSVTGGVVYRGSSIPSLFGKYIFADYVSGNIWALDESTAPATMSRIAGEGNIAAFGHDPSNGDVLMADLDGKIRRLVAQDLSDGFPQTLAQTGLFADPAALTPNPGLVAYDINLPFWSDNAQKRRWFGIPDPNAMVGFSKEGNWTLPDGMVWVKHFDIETIPGNPASLKRLETRVIVRNATGNYGVSYRWNEAGTAAALVPAEGVDFPVNDSQTWRIPSRSECSTCHSSQAGHALSFRTRQLNRHGTISGTPGNFIQLLADSHYLANLDTPPPLLPRHAAPSETEFSTEERARAYLDVNCAYCHNDAGTVPAAWDARTSLPLFETGLVLGAVLGGIQHPSDKLIVPGDDQRSVIVNRAAARNGYSRMPPIASSVTDTVGIQLLTDWINGEATTRQSYEAWRESIYGSPPTGGEPALDDDLDGRTNQQEFLAGTNPRSADPAPALAMETDGAVMDFILPAIPGRSVFLETSGDLVSWEKWNGPGNNGLPRNPANPAAFTIPRTLPAGFFRARIEER